MLKNLNFFLTLSVLALTLTQCSKKDCHLKPVGNEAPEIESYATANGIDAVAHSTGLYYEILNPGSGASVTPDSRIVITYVGKMLNGQIFDQQDVPNTSKPWALSNLIEGWRIGIPLIKKGGSIRLIVPSALGYGCEQYYDIPGNSILYFEINLVDIK